MTDPVPVRVEFIAGGQARLPESERARLEAEDAERERESHPVKSWWRRWLDAGRSDLERLWLSRD